MKGRQHTVGQLRSLVRNELDRAREAAIVEFLPRRFCELGAPREGRDLIGPCFYGVLTDEEGLATYLGVSLEAGVRKDDGERGQRKRGRGQRF